MILAFKRAPSTLAAKTKRASHLKGQPTEQADLLVAIQQLRTVHRAGGVTWMVVEAFLARLAEKIATRKGGV